MSRQLVCPHCKRPFGKATGRPRVVVDVKNLLAAYQLEKSVPGAAKIVGCSAGTARARLIEAGAIKEKG